MTRDNREDRGFQSIGSPMPKIVPLRSSWGSTNTKSSESSEIIGSPRQERAPGKSIGMPRGAIGAVGRQATAGAPASPEEADRELEASLPASVSRALSERRRDVSTPQYGYETAFDRFEITGCPPLDDVLSAISMVEQTLAPCGPILTERELLRLKFKTKARGLSDEEVAFQVQIYTQDLAEYPEDIVVSVLREHSDRDPWWPAWAELKPSLDERVKRRASLLEALRKAEWEAR